MARILLITYYYPPNHASGGQRPLKMAEYLPQYGHDVVVLTSSYTKKTSIKKNIIRVYDPSHNNNRVGRRRFQWLFLRLAVELLNRLGIHTSIYSPWKRSVLRKADEIIAQVKPEWILATYPPVETLEIGLHLSQKFNLPLIADFRDGLLFQPIEEKRLRSHRCVREKYAKTEAAVASASTLITVVTPVLQKYFRETYPGCRCETVFNGYDPQEWLDLPPTSLPSGFFHIVHTGRFALSDSAADIRPFLAALRQAVQGNPQNPIRLHLVGEHSRCERAWMGELLEKGIITIHPLMDRRQTLAFQKSADLLLVLTRPGVRSGIPLKLFEYLHAGKPILAVSDDPEVRRIVQDSGMGWCASPLDTPGIAALLERILADLGFHSSLERHPDVISSFSWEKQIKELSRLLASLPLGSPRTRAETKV